MLKSCLAVDKYFLFEIQKHLFHSVTSRFVLLHVFRQRSAVLLGLSKDKTDIIFTQSCQN